MNRRSSLAVLLGKKEKTAPKARTTTLGTLAPYTGTWSYEQAAHLLRRSMYGPTYAQINQAVADGLQLTIDQLFLPQPLPAEPIHFYNNPDPDASIGQTWVNGGIPDNPEVFNARARSLFGWTYKTICESGVSIQEKMTLFWHNHFVVSDITLAQWTYRYITFLRENALGNFKTLTEGITIDESMLEYLNGNLNTKEAPNENYARELLELFTVGKGELAGPGDYTTFTEQDVVEIARCLTGWLSLNPITFELTPTFLNFRHDTGTKQLSHRFGNAVITNEGENEYKKVIDIIFQQDEPARFISRKIYRWFVHDNINSDVEINIIEPMAQLILDNDWEIEPAVRALLSSNHFYENAQIGCTVAHPIDFFFKLLRSTNVPMPTSENDKYALMSRLFFATEDLEMVMYYPPSVAGWKAFYQEPQFSKFWINGATLPVRMRYSDGITLGVPIETFPNQTFHLGIDVIALAASLDNPSDPNELILEFSKILFPNPVDQGQLDVLKDVLIPGLPDFEWTVEYSDFASGNTSLEESVKLKLKLLISTMLKMPEFYLI